MKIRTVKYLLQEGFSNTYRNLLMSLASTMMVIASLLIFGLSMMITINLYYNLNRMKSNIDIVVFLDKDIAPLEADDIEQRLKNDERVKSYTRVSKQQAFAELEGMMENSILMEGLEPDFLYETFHIYLKNPDDSAVFTDELILLKGVNDVEFPREYLEKISIILKWVNVGSMFLLVLMLVISVFIIANTIKLTVFARRKEIGIMKYIGANDWFIRWPFIIEGMVLGLAGAIVSFIITGYLYKTVETYVNGEVVNYGIGNIIRMAPFGDIGGSILFVYIIIGLVMGAVGSTISVRKHLNV